MRTLVAYVPVLHEGYRRFFVKHRGPKELYLFGLEIIAEFSWLGKEIRQLDPKLMQRAIETLHIFKQVVILSKENIKELDSTRRELILPDEDITRDLAKRYFPRAKKQFDPVFLRWDKHNAVKERPVVPEEKISRREFDRRVIKRLYKEAQKSSDIWRRVGGAIVKNGKVLLVGHNHHLPSPHIHYVDGDPRNSFHKGDHIEISTSFHAEASLVAEAARRGISLEGTQMYVTTFPCPPCAKIIARSGVKALYYGGGYGVLDGEEILKQAGVKLIYVV